MTGKYDVDSARRRIVEFNLNGETALRLADMTGLKSLDRYHLLVATIDDTPRPDPGSDQAVATGEWLAAALRSARMEP
jgi:hypothetical protein